MFFSGAAETVFQAEWVRRLHAQIERFLTENTEWLGLGGEGGEKEDDDEDDDDEVDQEEKSAAVSANTEHAAGGRRKKKRKRRMMDYACGSGIVSRVS